MSRMPPSDRRAADGEASRMPRTARRASAPSVSGLRFGGLRGRLPGAARFLLGDHRDRVGELGGRDDGCASGADEQPQAERVEGHDGHRRRSCAATKTCTNASQSMTIIAADPSFAASRRFRSSPPCVAAASAAARAARLLAGDRALPARGRRIALDLDRGAGLGDLAHGVARGDRVDGASEGRAP